MEWKVACNKIETLLSNEQKILFVALCLIAGSLIVCTLFYLTTNIFEVVMAICMFSTLSIASFVFGVVYTSKKLWKNGFLNEAIAEEEKA